MLFLGMLEAFSHHQKVFEDHLPVRCENRFWVELDAKDFELFMTEAHAYAVLGSCNHFEGGFDGLRIHDQ